MPGGLEEDVKNSKIFESMDLWLIYEMNSLVDGYNQAFGDYEYNRALELLENFFWNHFCDNYLEIVKIRCYGLDSVRYGGKNLTTEEQGRVLTSQQSALVTIYHVYNSLLKLFAPFIPVLCEEIYSCLFEEEFRAKKSLHSRGNCARVAKITPNDDVLDVGQIVLNIVGDVRRYKSEKNISLREKLKKLTIHSTIGLESVLEDLENVCNTERIIVVPAREYALNFE
jgi:valyl-tRNA synthetase